MVTEIWPEIWTRPGDTNYGRVRDYVPFRSAGVHVGVNRIGDGNFEMSDSFAGFDDFLLTDTDTPANSRSSTVKWFSALDPTTPIAEWLPAEIVPGGSKEERFTKVTGIGINGLLGYARLEAFDWDGSDDFTPAQPDWEFGADNQIGNPGFEEPTITPVKYELVVEATGGTYTLTDGTDTTSAIAFNAQASTISTRLQTDIAAITDVVVVGTAASPYIRTITFVTPPTGITLAINTGSLTGGSATVTETQEGVLGYAPATAARTLSEQPPADLNNYDTFEFSDEQNHTPGGQFSLKIDPGDIGQFSNRNGGMQWVLAVTPGETIQASAWVFPTSATIELRLGLFTVGEEIVAMDNPGGATYTANTWTELTLSDVVVPDGVTQLIMRVQCTNSYPDDPGAFYVDDGDFFPGLPATTIGDILTQIYNHATDATLRSTLICWDDGSGTDTPYLTLDFTDSVDSAGNAWTDAEISTRLTMRQSYSQIMAHFVNEYGYEYRIVPNDVETGTYLWQVFNPGGMDATPDVAVQGGSSDVKRQLRRVAPGGTDQLVEGLGRVTARARNTALMGALGRIEASTLSREAPDVTAAASAASAAVSRSLQDISSVGYVFTGDLQDEPLSAYALGDTVTIVDPPQITASSKRFIDLEISVDADKAEWEAQYGALVITNADAAVADAVAGLLQKFEYPEIAPEGGPVSVGGGGGAPTVVVAASDASDLSKSKADVVCSGVNDQDVINTALDGLTGFVGGRVLLTEGRFNITDVINMPTQTEIQGVGVQATEIIGPSATWLIDTTNSMRISHCYLENQDLSTGGGISTSGGVSVIEHCVIFTRVVGDAIQKNGDGELVVTHCLLNGSGNGITSLSTGDGDSLYISDNEIRSCKNGILIEGTGANVHIVGNTIALSDLWAVKMDAGQLVSIVGNTFQTNGGGTGGGGISLASSSLQVVIAANAFIANVNGPDIDTAADETVIVGNSIRQSAGTASVHVTADTCIVSDNSIFNPEQDGVVIEGSDNVILGNIVRAAGSDVTNTYDNIRIEGDSNQNLVQGNKIIPSVGVHDTRYGINVAAATCDCNIVVGNDLGDPADYGTDALNDAGTDTQLFWPGDPVYGDNFTDCPASS